MYIADLHIHSRFSRATSKDCDLPHLDWWARRKGIRLLGSGDFTHPAWRAELKEQLVPAGEGVYELREDLRIPCELSAETPRFLITGEISSIYKRGGKTRKVHNLILLPSLEAAEELAARLEAIGNIHSDGRPILGLDSRDLLELTLETCPDAEFIPAHIWTPHFSMFGAFSGFDTIESCFDDLSPYIHAAETGLSSDPPMNWRVSALDRLTLVSHSDAHSPAKLGREANLLDTELSYPGLTRALRTGEGFLGTIEFFPEEGKYHLDGHRHCGVCLTPAETETQGGVCPVCGRKLTIGVEHRVEELADRPAGFRPAKANPYERLAPLLEVIAASTGKSASGKKTAEEYERLLRILGPEFYILRSAPIDSVERAAGPCVAEGIRRLRLGQVALKAGFDGEYGTISLLTPSEIKRFSGQISLFGNDIGERSDKADETESVPFSAPSAARQPAPKAQRAESLNPRQQTAVCAEARIVSVVAGPGTGKTKTLVSRIVHLIKECGAKPDEITAVTFTNHAAAELRKRLELQLGGKRAAARMTIGTFHAICLSLLEGVRLIDRGEALTLAAGVLSAFGKKQGAKGLLQAVSRVKNGVSLEEAGISRELYTAYCSRMQDLGVLDFDDVLIEALKCDVSGRKNFKYILVDEFQDINEIQYALIRRWKQKNLFVIGDPDQSIYGFRGATGRCFQRLTVDYPETQEIRLLENYRSTPEILAAAVPVIERNPGGARTIVPNRAAGAAVRLVQTADDYSEGIFIAKEIAAMTGGVDMLEAQKFGQDRESRAFSEIAVLCRTHRQLEWIETCLRHDDIPCVVSGREDFLDCEEVRSVLAFLRFLDTETDAAAPDESIRNLAEEWRPLVRKEKPWKLIARWEERYGSSPALEQLRNLAVFSPSLRELWNLLALGEEIDFRRAAGKGWEAGAVSLMTLHASKGLEFPAVFLPGLKAGLLPLESQGSATDLQEERRLFFVGMTRAREELILTTSQEPSVFIRDLPARVVRERFLHEPERIVEQLRLF